MRTVWKYPLNYGDTILRLPLGSVVLHVGEQPLEDAPATIWVEVDPESHVNVPGAGSGFVDRTFRLVGTGQPVKGDYVGTTVNHDGSLVWHIYEVTE